MFFIAIILLLVWFNSSRGTNISTAELWFMLSVFTGLAYIGGFLDSRIFARLDKRHANLLNEAETHYEETVEPG